MLNARYDQMRSSGRDPWRQTDTGVNDAKRWVEVPRETGRIGLVILWERLILRNMRPLNNRERPEGGRKVPSFCERRR